MPVTIAYKLKNPIAAINTVEGIRKHTNTLNTFPERNELDDDPVLADIGIRADYYKNYKIFYMIEENAVIVVRILYMLVDSRFWLYETFGLNE